LRNKSKAVYTPIGGTNVTLSVKEVDTATPFEQAAFALDAAAVIAEKDRDSGSLVKIAEMWIGLGHYLNNPDADDDREEGSTPLGFTHNG